MTETSPKTRDRSSRSWPLALSWALCIGCLLLLPVMWQGLKQVRLENDVESWLPEDDPNAVGLAWYHDHFEHFDRMLVSWDSSSLDDSRVTEFAQKVVEIEGVETATTPVELIEQMESSHIGRDEAIRRLTGVLVGTGTMKVRLSDVGRSRKDALIASIQTRSEEVLRFPLTIDTTPSREGAPVAFDFQITYPGIGPDSPRTKVVRDLINSLADEPGDSRVALLDDVFFEAGAPVAISVSINEAGDDALRPTMDAIRKVARDVGIAPDELRMGGSPIGGAELNRAVIKSVENDDYPAWMLWRRSPVLLSALISVVLAFVMLRSVRLALIVLAVGMFCVVATVSLVPPTGGSMSMVLIVMPNLLMVLTMSGAIHLSNYWKHSVIDAPDGTSNGVPIAKAVRQASEPCSMASFTTAIGLASLLTSLLTPVKDFGFYSAIGCGISLFMVLAVTPSMLRIWPGKVERSADADRSWWYAVGQAIVKHHVVVTSLFLIAFVACSAGLYYFKTETKVIRYFPDHTRIVQDYNKLESSLAGIVPVTVVIGFDGEGWSPADLQSQINLIRDVEHALAEHPEISGTISLADFIPDPPGAGGSRREQMLYNRRIASEINETVSGEVDHQTFVTRVHTPLSTTDRGRDVTFNVPTPDKSGTVPLGQEIWKVSSQVSIMSDMDYGTFLDQVDVILRNVINKFETEQQRDNGGKREVNYLVTGTVPLFLRTQQAVLESLIRSFGLAFAVIAVVMMIVLKGFRAGLITMLPNLLPVGVVFGAVSWYGIAVDIGTMITASVALGIAVDGTLHLISWYRDRLAMGVDPKVAIAEGLTHCGPAMWQTSSIVGFGMLALLGADLLLISRFGWLMAALIATALLADLAFLPSLLAGPLGRLIASRVQRATENDSESSSDDDADGGPRLRLVGTESA